MTDPNPFSDLDPISGAAVVSPATAISALALNFAMKYHDITTVQDGTLYQQYKLEGKNLPGLHLDVVFDTAKRIEAHILEAPNRLAEIVIEGVAEVLLEAAEEGEAGGADNPPDSPCATQPETGR